MAAIRIVSDPKIMLGKPVVEGTRITVEFLLEELAAGRTPAEIVRQHPGLSEEAIREALRFAARALGAEVVHPSREEAA